MSLKLYEMTANYRAFLDYDPDPTVEDMDAWNELLGELTDDIETKCISIGYVIKTLEAETATLKERKADIDHRMKMRKNKIEGLKSYAFTAMKTAGVKVAEAVDITVSIAKTPPSLKLIDDPDVLLDCGIVPLDFVKIETTIKKRELLADIKLHPDEYDWCSAESGEALRVK